MRIEHITYDENHVRRSNRRPSTTQNMTASCSSHSETKTLPTDERPITLWPKAETSLLGAQSEITTHSLLERRLEKEARAERTTPAFRSEEARRPRRRPVVTDLKTQPKLPTPPLRRKHKFSDSLRECLGSPRPAPKKEEDKRYDMTKIYTLRDAIRAAPPPASPKPLSKLSAPRNSHRKRSISASNRVGELIDRGADILDKTRKDLAGKFMPPFEHLNSSAFTRPDRKSRRNSDSSDLSFCCIGEKETEPTKEVQALKKRQQQNPERLSGEGTDPWTQPRLTQCKLCGKPGVRGIRGLCSDCEADFMRPNPHRYEFRDSSSSSDEDEIKPTPPLKDREILTARMMQEVGAKRKSLCYSRPNKQENRKPQTALKAELNNMTGTDNHPQIHSPANRPISQAAIVEGGDEERFRRWQTPAMKAEYERTTSKYTRWSDWSDGCETEDDSEGPITENEASSDYEREVVIRPGTARDTNFYGFYDDILEDHGAEEKEPFYPRRW